MINGVERTRILGGLVGAVLLVAGAGCGGKSTATTQTIGGQGAADVRVALAIFEQAGFDHLVVYSNAAASEKNLRSITDPVLRKRLRARVGPFKDFDCIHTAGSTTSLAAPLYACWWKTLSPERSSRSFRKVVRAALKATRATNPGEVEGFDIHRLTRVRVCQHWIVESYDSGSDPNLHARLQRAVSELRKHC